MCPEASGPGPAPSGRHAEALQAVDGKANRGYHNGSGSVPSLIARCMMDVVLFI